jgi:hypothetical protein
LERLDVSHAHRQIRLIYNGILYGAKCSMPYIVPVPTVDYYPEPTHIDFLATERWLEGGPLNRDCVNLEENRFVFRTWPGSTFPLRFCYTFYMMSQAITHYSMENYVVELLSHGMLHWRGDILVVKSTSEDPECPINMDMTDIELVNLLLLRYVQHWLLVSQAVIELDITGGSTMDHFAQRQDKRAAIILKQWDVKILGDFLLFNEYGRVGGTYHAMDSIWVV